MLPNQQSMKIATMRLMKAFVRELTNRAVSVTQGQISEKNVGELQQSSGTQFYGIMKLCN